MDIRTVHKLLLVFSLVLVPSALMAERFSTLEERMTYREFTEAGLHKLSEEELAQLNEWIRRRSLAEGEVVSSADPAADDGSPKGPPMDAEGPFETYIVGSFSGWNGSEQFEMGDGSVWEIVGGTVFHTPTMENPKVLIKRGILGSWNMSVEGFNTRAKVRRVR